MQDDSQPCTSSTDELGGVVLQDVQRQVCKALWISGWVPTEPDLESPARRDVHALARLHNLPNPQMTRQSQSLDSSKQGGNTRSSASPSCRLCCIRMNLVLSLPCDGMAVSQPRSSAKVVEVFKCPLHAHEMQCSWSCLSSKAAQAPDRASCQVGTWIIVFGSVRSLQLLYVCKL
jgi:hypothetical protein